MSISLAKMMVYPIKSTKGLELEESILEERGLGIDRRYMLIDRDGRFLTARKLPKMVTIQCTPEVDGFNISAPDMSPLFLPYGTPFGTGESSSRRVNIWKDDLEAYPASPEVNEWFSTFLHHPVQLVAMGPKSNRSIEKKIQMEPTSFADKYPLLLISEASLRALNEILDTPVTMHHFRPNLVVQGCEAFKEDSWSTITINGIRFRNGGPCGRCSLVNVNPVSGIPDPAGEPLKTLASFRKFPKGVMFGINLIPESTGTLQAGMQVEI